MSENGIGGAGTPGGGLGAAGDSGGALGGDLADETTRGRASGQGMGDATPGGDTVTGGGRTAAPTQHSEMDGGITDSNTLEPGAGLDDRIGNTVTGGDTAGMLGDQTTGGESDEPGGSVSGGLGNATLGGTPPV
jgi:hypothetical protein